MRTENCLQRVRREKRSCKCKESAVGGRIGSGTGQEEGDNLDTSHYDRDYTCHHGEDPKDKEEKTKPADITETMEVTPKATDDMTDMAKGTGEEIKQSPEKKKSQSYDDPSPFHH